MSTFFLIFAAVLFIATFGIYSILHNAQLRKLGMSTASSSLIILGLVSGFVLPVIPFAKLIDLHFIWIFLINIPVAWLFGPLIGTIILKRFATGKGIAPDMFYTFIAGIGALIIGFLI